MKKSALTFAVFLNIVLIASLAGAQAASTEENGAAKLETADTVQQRRSAPTLDLTISLEELSWEKLLELLPPALSDRLDDFGLSGLGSVTIQPKGSLDNLVISGEFDLSTSGIHYQNIFVKPDTERAILAFDVGIKGDSLNLSSLSFALGELMLNLSGNVSNFENPILDLQLSSNEFSLANLFSFFPDLETTLSESAPEAFQAEGGGRLQASAKGPVDDLDLDLKIDLDKSEIGYKDFFRKSAQSPGNITAQAHLGKDAVSIKKVSVNLGSFQVTTQGTVSNFQAPDLDVALETNLFDLEALLAHFPVVTTQYLPPELTLTGAGKLRLVSKGSLEDVTISGAVDMGQASIAFGEYFTKAQDIPGRLDFEVSLTKDAVEIRKMQLNLNDLLLDLKGLISGLQQDAMLDLSLSSPPIALDRLLELGFRDVDAMQSLATQYQGRIDLALQLKGSVDNPRGSAHISLNQLQYKGEPVPDIAFNVSLAQQQLQASLTAFRDMLSASFDLGLTPELPYRAEVLVEQADLERLIGLASDMEGISGSMTGMLSSEGMLSDLRQLSGELTLSELSLDLFGQAFRNREPIELAVTQQQLVVNSFELQGEKLKVFSKGFVDFQGESRLELDGLLDLRLIHSFLPANLGISSLDGRIHLLCTLEGSLDEPSLRGIAELHHGHVQSVVYPDPITNINGRVTLAQGKIAIPRLVGRISQGDVVVQGELAYHGGALGDFRVEMTGERLMLKGLVESLEVTISPSLTVSGNLDRQVLAGDIVIHEAVYNQDIDAIIAAAQEEQKRNISLVTTDSLNPSQSASAKTQPMTLNLAIETAKDIQVRNRQALLDLRADLRVRGSPVRPQITGLVEIVKGSFYLFNVRYEVLNARFDFFDPRRINPELNILLETLIQQYNISVGLEGNLDRLSLNTSSDPFLSENEILALLLQGAQRHLRIVQGPIVEWLEKTSRDLFNLDRVSLETTPLVLQGRTSQSPTLTLVKRLFDKLLLTYVTSVGGADKFQIFQGEYELSEKLSAAIRGDEKGDIDTNMMYEFRMK
ncbi:MAG: hypothetical protein GY801_13740 [bacterium]|nr:hypothetical protein [bacterium]